MKKSRDDVDILRASVLFAFDSTARRSLLVCSLSILLLCAALTANATASTTITINEDYVVDPSLPVIAGPVDFSATLIDASTVELAWSPALLDESEVSYFKIWNQHTLINTTTATSWLLSGIDRDLSYDFAVSAVTSDGVETRRSTRIYYDLPQLDANTLDGGNQLLPPLENLQARVIDENTAELTWDLPRSFWSWAEPSDYSYAVIVNNSYIDVVDEPSYVYTGLLDQGAVWIGVSAILRETQSGSESTVLLSRQPHRVLVDASAPVDTVTSGVTGFNSVSGLRAEVYSSTAAELFWDVGNGDTSHVFINGEMVARVKEGKSLFIEDLPPGERLLMSVGEGWPYDEPSEYAFLLYYDSPLMHTYIEMPDGAGPIAQAPNPEVTGLYSETYSSSAAEVFWDRSDAPLTRYRIYLNDEFLVETDGVSWFFDNLTASTDYRVGVVAVEPAGSGEFVSGSLLETRFSTLSDYIDPISDCQITGLYASVYSETAAEVFWDRDLPGTRYSIFLDNEFVSDTDAISWFMEGLEPGASHQFQINVSNELCDAVSFSVQFATPSVSDAGATNSAMITRQNHVNLLREVFRVYVGDYYTAPLGEVADFNITGRNPDFSFIDVFDCESGGFDQDLDPTSTDGTYFTFTFDQCLLEEEVRDGFVSGLNGSRGLLFDTAQYSVDREDGDYFEYTGSIQQLRSQTGFFDDIHSFDTTNGSFEVVIDDVNLSLANMNSSFAYGSSTNGLDSASLSGGFAVSLSAINDSPLVVHTPIELTYALNTRTDGASVDGIEPEIEPVTSEQRNSWTFASGQLEIVAEDGSVLLLDAATGNPDTARITISSENGVDTFEQNWSLWNEYLRFDSYLEIAR